MSLERARESIQRLRVKLARGTQREASAGSPVDGRAARELFESQLVCRLLDVEAHELRARQQGYYTICSAGHEGNAAVARALRTTDPALLHYRSGAFFLERARSRVGLEQAAYDILLSLAASASDPISGGRHKVFGSVPLHIPPQTSTIASHLPKAVGMAVALDRRSRLGLATTDGVPTDGIVVCSFGDASLNHSTAQGAINAAAWCAYSRVPVPVLFVCEDNGLGVSVRTPDGWVEARMKSVPGMHYVYADGLRIDRALEAATAAVDLCRRERRPVFLHLACVRVWGHAGSDIDADYRTRAEVEEAESNDPVVQTARLLLSNGLATPADLGEQLSRWTTRVRALSAQVVTTPKLTTRAQVMESIAPSNPDHVTTEARRSRGAASNCGASADAVPPAEVPTTGGAGAKKTLAHCIRSGLGELMEKYPEMVLFGEDVAQKGGVYGVTVGLWKAFGPKRVFNTLLDEQTILGLALGAGQMGLLPVAEIQFLAYLHNAEDQLRGEAATLSFFSRAQLKNPMVVRIAGLGYQKGFGGHFHNDNSLSVLRDLPGVIVGVPCRGDDAVRMLRTMTAAAKVDGRVCVIVEPIALYHQKDLHPGDGAWLTAVPPEGDALGFEEVGVYGDGTDVCIVTYGNGVPMSLRAATRLGRDGVAARVVDLRWIAPLPWSGLTPHVRACRTVLVVDECRRSGNVGEALVAHLHEDEELRKRRVARVASADSFIPLAEAAELVLLSEDEIVDAARGLASH